MPFLLLTCLGLGFYLGLVSFVEMAPSGPRLAMCVLALGLLWAIACEGGLQELEVTSLDSEDGCSGVFDVLPECACE